ncbi:MAG TPA: redoxin family protein [Elusimicrobiota bacterium]|nr:redoxin family protein [Elusimicrobiota bacterium]
MRLLFRVVLVLAFAAAARDLWFSRSASAAGGGRAPDLAYTDTQGGFHSLSAPGKPTVAVLWVTPCPYCARALNVLDSLRRDYAEKDLDVVGFYLNQADDASVDQIARQEGHSITMARGQPTGDFVQALTAGLAFRAPGRDIYVIGKDGRYEAVDSSDLNVADDVISQRVREILRDKHGVKERAG